MRRFVLGFALVVLAACGASEPDESAAEDVVTEAETVVAEPQPEPIDATGETCGGITGIFCPVGYYCQQEEGQCLEVMDGAGTCQVKPQMCTREYAPVCGCDGQTYGNDCEAAGAGVSIAALGECASPDTQ